MDRRVIFSKNSCSRRCAEPTEPDDTSDSAWPARNPTPSPVLKRQGEALTTGRSLRSQDHRPLPRAPLPSTATSSSMSSPLAEATHRGTGPQDGPPPPESDSSTPSSSSDEEEPGLGYCWVCLYHHRPRIRRQATLTARYLQRPAGPVASRTRRRTRAVPLQLTLQVRPVCDEHARFFARLLIAGEEGAADSIPWLLGTYVSSINVR